MKRRDSIKGLASLGAMTFLHDIAVARNHGNKKFHFIGLGSAGTTAIVQCKKDGFEGSYSCVTGSNVSHLTRDMYHHYFILSQESRHSFYSHKNFLERITLTQDMRSIFKSNDIYIILAGLGSCTGTGLISSVLEILRTEGKKYVAICSLPFDYEGRVRNDYAKRKKAELEKMENVLFFDHNSITEKYGRLPIREAFAKGDEIFCSVLVNQALPIIDGFKI